MKIFNFQDPTFKRYFNNFKFFSNLSVFRVLTNEKMESIILNGRVLDYGGGENCNYSELLKKWKRLPQVKFESINIDSKKNPTYLVKPEENLNIANECFDMVLSFNTFEHIYDLSSVFQEIYRLLKSNGSFVFVVPFIFRVHGHPDDFIRGTPSYWNKLLENSGFVNINIESLNWGPFSTGHAVSGIPGPFKKIRKYIALFLDIVYFKSKRTTAKIVKQDDPMCAAPLGYFICATKN
jgi:SAM-dependent methyltransferase